MEWYPVARSRYPPQVPSLAGPSSMVLDVAAPAAPSRSIPMTTTTQDPKHAAVAHAEREALALQDAEDQSAERFVDVRQRLVAGNQADEVTRSSEFKEWMAARAKTDEAWGRWAMAMDAAQG
jgi:hypothetical protein